MRSWWSRLCRTLAGRQTLADDLAAEIEAHLDLAAAENADRGMSPTAARDAARRRFGNVTLIRERAREAWGFPSLEALGRDLRLGLRGIRAAPGFSCVVILTLALGIGATTAIFSVVHAVLLAPLPYPEAERLVWLEEATPQAEGISVTWVNYLHWRRENHSFDEMAGFEAMHLTLTGRGEPLLTRAGAVTSGFLRLVGMRPASGRLLDDRDDQAGAPATAVLGRRFWLEKLGGDPAITGATLVLDGKPYQVVGVAARDPGLFPKPIDYYLPLAPFRSATLDRTRHGSMRVLGRLRPGVTLAAARADLDLILGRLARIDPGPEDQHHAFAAFLAPHLTRQIRPTLLVLMSAVGLVLLIAAANVASLVLARSSTRVKEMAIRTAIGAGRAHLVRQLLTENLQLAALGGASGVLLARWGLLFLTGMAPAEVPRLAETRLDSPVLLFAGALTCLTGLLVGLVPLWTSGKLDLLSALKDGSRLSPGALGGAGGAGATGAVGARFGASLRSALVVFEIALTLVLAFASGLLLRSLIAAQTLDPGFRAQRLLALELVLPASRYASPLAARGFYQRLEEDLRALPGVAAVSAVLCPPAAGDCNDSFYAVLDRPAPAPGELPVAAVNFADPSYFGAMAIALRRGRAFTAADRAGAPCVAIVNETFARKWWPGVGGAVGRGIQLGGPALDGPRCEIVGVAGNVSQLGLDAEPLPEIFLPFAPREPAARVVMIRTAGDPEPLVPAVRNRVAMLDRGLAIESLRPLTQSLAATLARRRFGTLLLTLFAGLAMTLAGIGVYGLLSYWVSAREESIAIRVALGAPRGAIFRWVGGQALALAAAGTALGAAASWAASRWAESLVFGVSPRSPSTMGMAVAAVIAIALLAALVPACRAARLDPVQRLRRLGQ
jgi:predicted permease